MPLPVASIEEIEALARSALRAGPVFQQRTAVENAFDVVRARRLSFFRDGPAAYPEVELVGLRSAAATLGFSSAFTRLAMQASTLTLRNEMMNGQADLKALRFSVAAGFKRQARCACGIAAPAAPRPVARSTRMQW